MKTNLEPYIRQFSEQRYFVYFFFHIYKKTLKAKSVQLRASVEQQCLKSVQ